MSLARFAGATQLIPFEDSAFQTLPSRVVRLRNKRFVKRIEVAPVIAAEAKSEQIDPLIIEIIMKHESGFEVNAASGVGASGLMQLMPSTAFELGVRHLCDPAENIRAGTRYFARQYRRFGSLPLALAAYNAGPGNVQKSGGVPLFWETMGYVRAIAGEYKLRSRKRSRELPTSLVVVGNLPPNPTLSSARWEAEPSSLVSFTSSPLEWLHREL